MQQAEEGLTAVVKDSHSDLCKLEKLNANLTNDLANSHRKVSEQKLKRTLVLISNHCIVLYLYLFILNFFSIKSGGGAFNEG